MFATTTLIVRKIPTSPQSAMVSPSRASFNSLASADSVDTQAPDVGIHLGAETGASVGTGVSGDIGGNVGPGCVVDVAT